MKLHATQRGVALVTALVIVTLAATAAALLANHGQYQIRRSANLFNADQARQYVLGAEAWAMRVLAQDLRDSRIDSLDEAWATILPPIEIPGGAVTGYIVDLQGGLNVNNLVVEGKADPLSMERARRLLAYVGLAPETVQALVDWIDPDIQPLGAQGAEDDLYLALERPYRAANRPMVSISELRLVRGITPEAYAALVQPPPPEAGENADPRLRPLMVALPAHTPVNVNTAPLPVLQALGLPEDKARAVAAAREQAPFESVEAFLRLPAVADSDLARKAGLQADLAVSSEYFMLVAEARVDRARAPLISVLHRAQNGMMHVVMRSRGTL